MNTGRRTDPAEDHDEDSLHDGGNERGDDETVDGRRVVAVVDRHVDAVQHDHGDTDKHQ